MPPVLDWLDPAYAADPHAAVRHLRPASPAPVDDSFGGLVLLHHTLVESALRDHRGLCGFGARAAESLGISDGPFWEWNRRNLLGLDPPDHNRIRKAVAPFFTPERAMRLRQRARDFAAELWNEVAGDEQFDFLADFAARLPMLVIGETLGLPQRDYPLLAQWSTQLLPASPADRPVADAAAIALREYAMARLADAGDEGVLGAAGALDPDEQWALVVTLVFAGYETTRNLLGNAVFHLLRRRDQWEALLADRSLVAGAVEELLRYESPAPVVVRVAAAEMEIGGRRVAPGTLVTLHLLAANRDPAAFADPDRLDVTRAPAHVAFGAGIHHCLGAALARVEVAEALHVLLEQAPALGLVEDPAEARWLPSMAVRGLERLVVSVR